MKDIKLNLSELNEVVGGSNLVIEMDPKVMEQVIKNAQPLGPPSAGDINVRSQNTLHMLGGLSKKQYTGFQTVELPTK